MLSQGARSLGRRALAPGDANGWLMLVLQFWPRKVLLKQIFLSPPLPHFDHTHAFRPPEFEPLGMTLNGTLCSKRAPGALRAQPRGAAEGSSEGRWLKALTLAFAVSIHSGSWIAPTMPLYQLVEIEPFFMLPVWERQGGCAPIAGSTYAKIRSHKYAPYLPGTKQRNTGCSQLCPRSLGSVIEQRQCWKMPSTLKNWALPISGWVPAVS